MNKFLFIVFALFLQSCQSDAQVKISIADMEKTMNNNSSIQLVDVRTPEEFNTGHLAKAVNMNIYDDDFAQKTATLSKEKPVYVYCAVGGRSGQAAAMLTKAGYKVYDLAGGYKAWSAAKKPIVK